MKKKIYVEGQLIGNCYYLKDYNVSTKGPRQAVFRCKCGNEFIGVINKVQQLEKKSCGCLPTCCAPKHGGWGSRLYTIWNDMKDRCNNPNSINYAIYGGKGVKYTAEWEQFEKFQEWALANGYSVDLTIDRINSEGNYEPSNCRWANAFTQAQNRGKNKNNVTGYKGVSFCKQTNKYKASIGYFNKQKTIGRYTTAKEAAKAYNDFVIEHNMEHTLNEI